MELALPRRTLLAASAAALPLIRRPAKSAILSETDLPVGQQPDFTGPLSRILPFGTAPATSAEEKRAALILAAAPQNKTPVEVAGYFLTLTGQDARYRGGWPDRWNPVIVEFFTATKTHPTGDVTPWCAAFVNWCLRQAGLPYPSSASSGTFRYWGTPTLKPQRGDLAVFAVADAALARLGQGHVGFVLDGTAAHVLLLGGNQVTQHGHHEISEIRFETKTRSLILHSYRTNLASVPPGETVRLDRPPDSNLGP